MTPDWEALRQAYTGGESIGKLARRWEIPESTLRARAKREGWRREEKANRTNKEKNVRKEEQDAQRMNRVDDLADRMLACLERAVEELDSVTRSVREKVKKEDGTDVTTDYSQVIPGEKGLIDRGGLKQLTGVLKDLKEVLALRSQGDALEQEARIAKLQRELTREDGEQRILVTMEGGCEHYAG